MKAKKQIAAAAVAVSLLTAGMATAATVSVVVDSKLNSLAGSQLSRGLDTGVTLVAGHKFSITADPLDAWSIGTNVARHLGTADGAPSTRLYTFFGQTFNHGTLVGKIGEGLFFRVGSSLLNEIANASGALKLFMWDTNFADNSGDIKVDIALVPLPASAPLLLAGLGGLAALRRRRKQV